MSRCSISINPLLVGDPVDVSKGAAIDETIDFRLIGPLEFRWTRYYDSSMSHRQFGVGWGHSHSYDLFLRMDLDGLSYQASVGPVIGFPPIQKDGELVSARGYRLQRVSSFRYRVLHYAEASVEFEFSDFARPARPKRLFRGSNQILFEYDSAGKWTRIIDSQNRSIRVLESPDRRIEGLILEAHREMSLISYRYDERGNMIRTADSSGHGFQCAYDDRNRMIRRTGRKGYSFYFSYDSQGRCIKSVGDDRMHEVSLQYDGSGRITKVTQADGGLYTYIFDDIGRIDKLIDALGGIQAFVHDPTGRLQSQLDQNGNASKIAYNAPGAPVAKINPLGYRIPLPQDPNFPNPRVQRIAANPAEYEFGRQLAVDDLTLPDPVEVGVLPVPSEALRFVVTRPPLQPGSEIGISFQPPPLGRRWWPRPNSGRRFNDLGRLVQQQDQWGRIRSWDYDASGNLSSFRDFDGAEWVYDCANWHLRKAETNPLGASVRFTHTTSGRVDSFTDAGGALSEYSYDLNDRLTAIRRHGLLRDKYTRDAAGNLIAKHASGNRMLLELEVGPGNLPLKRTLASGDQHTLEYDKSGRIVLAATRKDRIEFRYDSLGNRCADLKNGSGIEQYFERRHMPVESTFFGRFRVRYDYLPDGTLVITDPGGTKHTIQFHRGGIVERRFSNSSRETAQYDKSGRCLFKCVRHASGKMWSRVFEWSGEGELRSVKDNQFGDHRHEYDRAHQLRRRIVPGGGMEEYVLDIAGNLLGQPGLDRVLLQQGNRLAEANGETFEYNDRNHISFRRTAEGEVVYEYDSRDFLTRVIRNAVWEADYDPLGRRTRKTFGGQTTEFFWNTGQLVAELQPEGRLRIYVYPDTMSLTPLLYLDFESTRSGPQSCRRFFVFSDQIGTPYLVEDESGSVVWRASIEPYGFANITTAGIDFNLRFPGHYFDAETGLHYNGFRYYDPRLGRYLQSDPWGPAHGYNLYAYCPNPLLRVDVRGLGEEDDPECNPHADDEEDPMQQWEATILTPEPESEGKFPPPTEESTAAAAAVVAAMNDPANGLTTSEQSRMVVGLSTDEGIPIVAISGREDQVQPIIDRIGPGLERQGITVAPAAVDTSTLDQPGTRRDGSTFPGSDNTCAEAKAHTQAGQMGATPTGQTAMWGNPDGKQPTGVTPNPDGTYPPCSTVCEPNESNITALSARR